jgi:hypothetical protein
MKCSLYEDCGWVCESHPDRPWQGKHVCTCGGAPERPARGATRAKKLHSESRNRIDSLNQRVSSSEAGVSDHKD